jgi:hypothetical protein
MGAQLAGRGPWHAGIAKFLKMKDFFAENFGNFVLRKISGTFVFEKITSTSPPIANIFLKIFCFPGSFFWGALEWKGAKILEYTPPNRKPIGTALDTSRVHSQITRMPNNSRVYSPHV